jgi:hypothetical protein
MREETGRISPEHRIACDVSVIEDKLRRLPYPLTKAQMIALSEYWQVPCQKGHDHSLADVLRNLSKDQYNSPQDVRDALENAVLES